MPVRPNPAAAALSILCALIAAGCDAGAGSDAGPSSDPAAPESHLDPAATADALLFELYKEHLEGQGYEPAEAETAMTSPLQTVSPDAEVQTAPTTMWDGDYSGTATVSVTQGRYESSCESDLALVVGGGGAPSIVGSMECHIDEHTVLSFEIEGDVAGSVASGVLTAGTLVVPWEGVFFRANRPFLSASIEGETFAVTGHPAAWRGHFTVGFDADDVPELHDTLIPVPVIVPTVSGPQPLDVAAQAPAKTAPSFVRTELPGLAFASLVGHVERVDGGVVQHGREFQLDHDASSAADDFGGLYFLPGSAYEATWDRYGWTVVVRGDVASGHWIQRGVSVSFDSEDGVAFQK